MGTQLALFGQADAPTGARPVYATPQADAPTGARPVYATPQACTLCPVVATIFSRLRAFDGTVADLCAACTAAEVRRRRVEGLHVPAGFEWVV